MKCRSSSLGNSVLLKIMPRKVTVQGLTLPATCITACKLLEDELLTDKWKD